MLSRAIALFLCLASGAMLLAATDRPERHVIRTPFSQFPMDVGGWKGERLPPIDDKIVAVLGVDDYLNRAYFSVDRSSLVGLYIGYYGSQRQGDTMHSPLNCIPGAGWEPLSNSRIPIEIGNGTSIIVNRYIVQKGLDRQLVLYWYQSHGRAVASEYWSKLYLIGDAVRLNRTDGALVRVIAPIALGSVDDGAAAEREATGFVQTFHPQLDSYLPR
jgi:EpsI family protein